MEHDEIKRITRELEELLMTEERQDVYKRQEQKDGAFKVPKTVE